MAISNNRGGITARIDSGVTAKVTTRLATATPLAANTYDNGISGVGATITIDAFGVLADIDGVTPVVGDRILVKDEVAALKIGNGFYKFTTQGDGSTSAILTRSRDADENAEVGVNTNAFVSEGTANADQLFTLTTDGTIDIGTTELTFESATGGGASVYNLDGSLASERTVTMGAFGITWSGNQSTFKGINDSGGQNSMLATDSNDLATFRVSNNGVIYLSGITGNHTQISKGIGIRVFNADVERARLGLQGNLELRNSGGAIHHNLNTGTHSYLMNNNVNLGIGSGVTSPTAKVHIKGIGATSATFGLKVDNSASVPLLYVRDDGNVSIGTSTPNAESLLELKSTTKALRFTRMTTTQRTAMTGASGFLVLDTDLGFVFYHTGSAWIQL